ncbi:MAG: NADPH-dependent FMN reductase [Chloroflexota bacterium]
MSERPLTILGIAGSLRRASWHRGLIRAAADLAPAGVAVQPFDLAPIPMYNGDVEAAGYPDTVQALRRAIESADALLLASPEYNWSIPGVLKNAIDWASRGPGRLFRDKPVALLGASGGAFGTARVQLALRQTFTPLGAVMLPEPHLLIGGGAEKFDADGNLTDAETRDRVAAQVAALAAWARRVNPA